MTLLEPTRPNWSQLRSCVRVPTVDEISGQVSHCQQTMQTQSHQGARHDHGSDGARWLALHDTAKGPLVMFPTRHVFTLRVLVEQANRRAPKHASKCPSPTESRIGKNLFDVRILIAPWLPMSTISKSRKFEGPANVIVIYKPSLVFSINLSGLYRRRFTLFLTTNIRSKKQRYDTSTSVRWSINVKAGRASAVCCVCARGKSSRPGSTPSPGSWIRKVGEIMWSENEVVESLARENANCQHRRRQHKLQESRKRKDQEVVAYSETLPTGTWGGPAVRPERMSMRRGARWRHGACRLTTPDRATKVFRY